MAAEPAPSLGAVRVASEVIASIAQMAALEVDGVASMDEPAARPLSGLLRRGTAHRGVRVTVEPGGTSLSLVLFVKVRAVEHVTALAVEIQDRVTEAIERMLGLTVSEVTVRVTRVVYED